EIGIERGGETTKLATGAFENGGMQALAATASETAKENPLAAVHVARGEMLKLSILPKSSHACDTTLVDLEITEREGKGRKWNVTSDLLPDLVEGGARNPHADSHGNEAVWYLMDGLGAAESGLARLWTGEIGRAALAQPAEANNREVIARAAAKV